MSGLIPAIKRTARELGFEVIGITSAAPLLRDDAAYREWCAAGFAAGMDYMIRRPDLHAAPSVLVPHTASVITLSVNYYASAPNFSHQNRYGRVARYAWGRDYHEVVKPRLTLLTTRLEALSGQELHARCFVDAVPLLERALAARAGLGFFGKNTNLLQSSRGSWFFLAEILVDLELPAEDLSVNVSCGTCHRCLDACPTKAFAGPYRLDSRRCISYLTIENKGAIPRELREGVGEWIFGCDVCQDVCPFNRFSTQTDWPHLMPEAGVGTRLDLVEMLSISTDAQFRNRFSGTPLMRAKRRGLLRNAAVVAANVDCTAAVPLLVDLARSDPEPVIRAHAVGALSRLDGAKACDIARALVKSDADDMVRDEAAAVLG
jgi:epoxyqueuosine reductase